MSDRRVRLLLSLQRALRGAVSPAMRAVGVDWDEKAIRIVAIIDGPISDEDEDAIQVVGSEVAADFSDVDRVEDRCVRLDAPAKFWDLAKEWVYQRRE
jgi:hypothetical protein